MIVQSDDDGRLVFRYAWCETCGGPVYGAERVERHDVEEIFGDPRKTITPTEWRVQPCGHGTWSIKDRSGPVFTVGLVETVGESFAPFPGVSIAGCDPSKRYEPPVAV